MINQLKDIIITLLTSLLYFFDNLTVNYVGLSHLLILIASVFTTYYFTSKRGKDRLSKFIRNVLSWVFIFPVCLVIYTVLFSFLITMLGEFFYFSMLNINITLSISIVLLIIIFSLLIKGRK